MDFKGAELRDFAEIENLEKGGPIAIADQIIVNDGSIEKSHSDLDKFLIDFNSDPKWDFIYYLIDLIVVVGFCKNYRVIFSNLFF